MFLKIRPILVLIFCFNFKAVVIGQNVKDSILPFPLIKVSLAVQVPEGDLKNYFGVNSNIGCSFGLKNKKNQTLEFSYNFIHSKNVKFTEVIDHLLNSQGWIINQHGEQNLFVLYQRGGSFQLISEKYFPF